MFGPEIRFMSPWRPYQERVLKEVERHLSDDKLHIIAPPGSGKTVLGLEVVRRLNKPTLILSPTITIRNQWIHRFAELFSDGRYKDSSFRLKEPAFITSSTYQSLYAAHTKGRLEKEETDDIPLHEETEEADIDLIRVLRERGVGVLVLDEAHHLKSAWWKSLMTVVKALPDLKIISLTATPPYDSTAREWARYNELCGPVDAEITVPELVKERNLCPHQDLVFQSGPTPEELQRINGFYHTLAVWKAALLRDEEVVSLFADHPLVQDPESYLEEIYDDIAYCGSMVIFLHSKGRKEIHRLLKVLGMDSRSIPRLSDEWLEILLSSALYRDARLKGSAVLEEIKKELKEAGAIERKRVFLTRKESLNKMMATSLSKFASIRRIVDFEYAQLKSGLRLVVLSDFVRKEALRKEAALNQFGILPIFRYLYDTNGQSAFDYADRIAVLSGTVCIIPGRLAGRFRELAGQHGLNPEDFRFQPLPGMEPFSQVHTASSRRSGIVRIVTALFTQGEVNILIGTKSLLGEGWDCPAINSLILATFVGSYMLSNQMRGRAIRTDPETPGKTSNIWHLLCRDGYYSQNNGDLRLMEQRFRCFAGLHAGEDVITNGLGRIGLSAEKGKDIPRWNREMETLGGNRERLFERWFTAIHKQTGGRAVKELKSPKERLKRTVVFRNTLRYLLAQAFLSSLGYTFQYARLSLEALGRQDAVTLTNLLTALRYGSFIAAAAFLIPTVKAFSLFIRHRSLSSSLKQIGLSLLESMSEFGLLEEPRDVRLSAYPERDGTITCQLKGASPFEQSVFLQALEEVIGPVGNPRYLLTRESGRIFGTLDYHGVPSVFGGKKERAEVFHQKWQKHMGRSTLYYTRNQEGRAALVRARGHSLASAFQKNTEIVDSWKS